MRVQGVPRALAGIALLALAVGAAVLSNGVADAARSFRETQAQWQRGVMAETPGRAGAAQALGERLLGVRARSELMRAYLDYRVGISSVIEGTAYPQTQARWNAISTIRSLRPSLARAQDRAAADVTLGVVYAASAGASAPGQQRQTLVRYAVESFSRAVLEDPANAEAKYDLELLLAAAAQARAQERKRNAGRQERKGNATPTPHSTPAGTGY
jgi:hypothetical protein